MSTVFTRLPVRSAGLKGITQVKRRGRWTSWHTAKFNLPGCLDLHCSDGVLWYTVGLQSPDTEHRKRLQKARTLPSVGKTHVPSGVPASPLQGCCYRDVEERCSGQLFSSTTEGRTNLAGCGSNALELGFKLFISSQCPGLFLTFIQSMEL